MTAKKRRRKKKAKKPQERVMPRYPVYVPSKGRFELGKERDHEAKTHYKWVTQCLEADGVPHYLVIEEQEYDDYARSFGEKNLLVLPFSNLGSVIPARNWIKEHSRDVVGAKRHWQIDDNIACFKRRYKGRRVPCRAGLALRTVEDFVDRYENVAVAGLNYEMFIPNGQPMPPFYLNGKVYSCSLILNEIPHMWRGNYNEDADLCLQVLADGYCTVAFNAFMVWKCRTMLRGGGNSEKLYAGDGRAKMARSLERLWPYVVTTERRFKRPQHVVRDAWTKFDNKLIRRKDIDWEALEKGGPQEYGMKLKRIAATKNKELEAIFQEDLKD